TTNSVSFFPEHPLNIMMNTISHVRYFTVHPLLTNSEKSRHPWGCRDWKTYYFIITIFMVLE
ncbi:MAG: hypothetical protein D6732_00450, partial [Methanobacteriota archaeon]